MSEPSGAAFGALQAARARTERQVEERTAALAEHPVCESVSTAVFGSWARGELTDVSDDDWAVLVGRPFVRYDRNVCLEVVAATEVLGVDDRRPGEQNVFGLPFDVTELVRNIGLDADTKHQPDSANAAPSRVAGAAR
ncbi:MAG: hypothetical protein QOF77_177 [Solirubrobacteraceae bacterium]|nr:hypothetical protein [Solirubrobacteraceae bacterium]